MPSWILQWHGIDKDAETVLCVGHHSSLLGLLECGVYPNVYLHMYLSICPATALRALNLASPDAWTPAMPCAQEAQQKQP